MMRLETIPLGLIIILIGISLVIYGSILLLLESKETKVEGGLIIWIGPFPLALTTSRETFYLLLGISLIFIFLLLVFYFIKR